MRNIQHNVLKEGLSSQQTQHLASAIIAIVVSLVLALSPGLAFAQAGTASSAGETASASTASDEAASSEGNLEDEASVSSAAGTTADVQQPNDPASEQGSTTSSAAADQNADQADGLALSAQESSEPELSVQATDGTVENNDFAYKVIAKQGPLNISLTLDPNTELTCSKDRVRFKVNVEGATGTVGINPNYLDIECGGKIDYGSGLWDRQLDYGSQSFNWVNTHGLYWEHQFEAPGTYRLSISARDGNNSSRDSLVVFEFYVPSKEEGLKSVNERIDQIVKDANIGSKSSYDKIEFVHDQLLQISNTPTTNYSGASSLLLYGRGDSKSYAEAMRLILSRLGYSVDTVYGNGQYWTRVKYYTTWMHVDAYADWKLKKDRPTAKFPYLYFGLTDSQMRRLHNEYTPDTSKPANDYKAYYYYQKGLDDGTRNYYPGLKYWSDEVRSQIDSAMKSANDCKIPAPSVSNIKYCHPDVYSIIGENVASYLNEFDNLLGGKRVQITFVYNTGNGGGHWRALTTNLSNTNYTKITGLSSSYDFTGRAIEPKPTVTFDGVVLTEGKDYRLEYSNNVVPNPNGKVRIVGTGYYTGYVDHTFKIVSQPSYAQKVSGTWKKSGKKWWYAYDSATKKLLGADRPKNMWIIDSKTGKHYHFDSNGYMHSGWLKTNGNWYYLASDGAMRIGWQKVGGKWYYLNPSDGIMMIGWTPVGSSWYYLNSNGAMKTGWLKYGTKWFYLKGSGACATGWVKSGKKWYYLDPASGVDVNGKRVNGAMVSNTTKTIGTKEYLFNKSGVMMTGWQQMVGATVNGVDWYYFYSSGAMAKGAWVKSGKYQYWLKSDGTMATNEWVGNGSKYWVDSKGRWVPGAKK